LYSIERIRSKSAEVNKNSFCSGSLLMLILHPV
jgi:hypothetical protein